MVSETFQDREKHEHETEIVDMKGNERTFWCTSNVAARDSKGKTQQDELD